MFRTALVAAAAVLAVAACAEKPAPAAGNAPAPGATGSAKADIDNPKSLYRLRSDATAQVKPGGEGTLTLAVQPNEGVKVKPETPFKAKLSATAPVELAKTELGYADNARVERDGPVFEVPFKATSPGAGNIDADMTFFVCTAEACVRTTEKVQLPVTVQE